MMGKKKKGAWIVLCVVAVLMLAAGLGFYLTSEKAEKEAEPETKGEDTELSGRVVDFPEEAMLGEYLGDLRFETEDGKEILLSEKEGEYLILLYWGSWCPYCKEQLEMLDAFERAAERYGQFSFLLVDVLDEEKESVEKAVRYLEDQEITMQNVFDRDRQVYDRLGIRKIPTMFFLSPEGRLLAVFADKIKTASEFQSILAFVKEGYDSATKKFLLREMMNEDGGILTGLQESGQHPSGSDVLSESQGLLMEYAAEIRDQALFDRVYGFAKERMEKNGLFLWYVSSERNPDCNSFLDDLRIYGALLEAEELWGRYGEDIESLEEALCRWNLSPEGPVDFYDFGRKEMGDEFLLGYGDLETIRKLEERTGSKGLYKKVRKILEDGYISDSFPLYYASWSYSEAAYSGEDLNMAEAVYTLYHLAKAGLLEKTSEKWLEKQLETNGIMARYHTDGTVSEGYGYESTGIYALTAMIGMECGNEKIVTFSIERMNRLRIFDSSVVYDGAFGNEDGTGMYSFDQCMALRAYGMLNKYIEKK